MNWDASHNGTRLEPQLVASCRRSSEHKAPGMEKSRGFHAQKNKVGLSVCRNWILAILRIFALDLISSLNTQRRRLGGWRVN